MTSKIARHIAIAAIASLTVVAAAEAAPKNPATTAKGTTAQQTQPYYGYPQIRPSAVYTVDGERQNFRAVERDTRDEGFPIVRAPRVGR